MEEGCYLPKIIPKCNGGLVQDATLIHQWRIHLSLAICERRRHHGGDTAGFTTDAERPG